MVVARIIKAALSGTGRHPWHVLTWLNALLVDHAIFRLFWTNFSAMIPGRLVRNNHRTPGQLARLTRRYGLRVPINLRGPQPNNRADTRARATAARRGLEVPDVALKGGDAPDLDGIERQHDSYVRIDKPMLIHCRSGADRTGFVAGLFVLFDGGRTVGALRRDFRAHRLAGFINDRVLVQE
jgi:hypothetical protein